MLKKYAEVLYEGKPIYVLEIKECTPLEFIEKNKKALRNLQDLKIRFQTEKQELKKEINNLKEEIKHLKGED